MSRKELIQKNKSLFWYTPEVKKAAISDRLLVETILNYGSLDDVRELFAALVLPYLAEVFFSSTGRQIGNYPPEVYNFFKQVFNRYATQRNPQ